MHFNTKMHAVNQARPSENQKSRAPRSTASEKYWSSSLASDLSASLKSRALFHAESLCFDVALEEGLLFQLAALRRNGAFDPSVKLHFTRFHISLDVGILGDGHFALFGNDFPVDLPIDDHVIGKLDRSIDFDPLSEHVCCVGHNVGGI